MIVAEIKEKLNHCRSEVLDTQTIFALKTMTNRQNTILLDRQELRAKLGIASCNSGILLNSQTTQYGEI